MAKITLDEQDKKQGQAQLIKSSSPQQLRSKASPKKKKEPELPRGNISWNDALMAALPALAGGVLFGEAGLEGGLKGSQSMIKGQLDRQESDLAAKRKQEATAEQRAHEEKLLDKKLKQQRDLALLKARKDSTKNLEGLAVPQTTIMEGSAPTKDDAKIVKGKNEKAALLQNRIADYKALVNEFGTEVFEPRKKMLLDQAKRQLQIAYKEFAELGALTAPDIGIIEGVAPSATDVFSINAWNPWGASNITESLDSLSQQIEQDRVAAIKSRGYAPIAPEQDTIEAAPVKETRRQKLIRLRKEREEQNK